MPDATLEVSQYLFHHPGVDFIWTTGGPKAVAATNEAGKPCIGVGPGNAPVYVHASADIPMAVVDVLISKTFDASVICPAEQTIVADEPIHDELVAELQRMGARVLDEQEVERLAGLAFEEDGRVRMEALGRSCVDLAALAGFAASDRDKVLVAPLPSDLEQLAAHPLVQEKLMPVLGLVRSPSVRARHRRLRAGHRARRPRPHVRRSTRPTTRSSTASPSGSARGGSSSTHRRRSARWAASTTR